MKKVELKSIQNILPYLIKHKTIWSYYDTEADVLYIHFKKPSHADNSEMTEDEMIIRYQKNEVVGITILNASKRIKKNKKRG